MALTTGQRKVEIMIIKEAANNAQEGTTDDAPQIAPQAGDAPVVLPPPSDALENALPAGDREEDAPTNMTTKKSTLIKKLRLTSVFKLFRRSRAPPVTTEQAPEKSETGNTKEQDPANPESGQPPKPSAPKKSRKEGKADPSELGQRFKRTLSRPNVKVHFVGAW